MTLRENKERNNKKKPRFECLERRELLAADFMQQNPLRPTDIDNDGTTSPRDALILIDSLNAGTPPLLADGQELFMDANNDNQLTAGDVLQVINQLNLPDPTPIQGGDVSEDPTLALPPDAPPLLTAPLTASQFASVDGSGNNLEHSEWGSVGQGLERWAAVEYADGVAEPGGEDRISARAVSNLVNASPGDRENSAGLSDLTWLFGQFIDHDIDLSESGDEAFDIEVPIGDPWFDPFGTGEASIGLNRTHVLEDTDVRTQFNEISAFIDGSVIYGSDQERADALRSFEGGRLATSEGDLLPFNLEGLTNAGGDSEALFLAGDVRANENAALTSMHTLWVREHNRVADQIADDNPELTDEEIYQQARQFVTAELQSITYNEFLPALLGDNAISEYNGYDATVNPNIANVFSTAAYRFGHTMLSSELQRLNNDGSVIEAGNIALQDAFFNVAAVADNGIESLLLGASVQTAQEVDPFLVDDVRNFLFGPPGAGGLDLASLNIQRGRDHGLADYNQIRVDMGLDPVTSFADISSNPEIQSRLAEAYADVDSIDAWVGMLAEDHVQGSTLGETATTIIAGQFINLRDGDRFYFENVFRGRQLNQIENTTLADVIERNTSIDFRNDANVFFASEDGITLDDGRDGDGQQNDGPNGDGDNGDGNNGGGDNGVDQNGGGQNGGGQNNRRARGAGGPDGGEPDGIVAANVDVQNAFVVDQVFAEVLETDDAEEADEQRGPRLRRARGG